MRRRILKNQRLMRSRAMDVLSGATEFLRLTYGRAKVVAFWYDPNYSRRKSQHTRQLAENHEGWAGAIPASGFPAA